MKLIVFAAHGCPVGGLGPYGNEWIATPNLDRLAAEGIVYDRHFADTPDSLAARRAWWGDGGIFRVLPPAAPRILIRASRPEFDAPAAEYAAFSEIVDARPTDHDEVPGIALLRALPSLLDRLARESDYLVWIECDRLLPPWQVPQDVFDVYIEDLLEEELDEHGLPVKKEETEYADEPLTPWSVPPVGPLDPADAASWEMIQRSFATAVTVFDAELGRYFEMFRERHLDSEVTIMFTSDFGYPLGDHGFVGLERPHLHEGFVHLPLIVRRPAAEDAGRRIWTLTQPRDLPAVLLGEPLTRTEAISALTQAGASEWSIRTETHAFLLPVAQPADEPTRSPMLFIKPDDRWEVNDVSGQHPEVAEELESKLRALLSMGR